METNERAGLIIMILTASIATISLVVSEPAYPSQWVPDVLPSISVIPLWNCDSAGQAWCFTWFSSSEAFISRFGIPSRYVFVVLLGAFAYGLLVYLGALRSWKGVAGGQ